MCCSWCPDDDGDGSPDYEYCCSGERSDGELGCEDTHCDFHCNGLDCGEHEDQPTCEANGGTWAADEECVEYIAMQPMMAMDLQSDGFSEDFVAAWWLGSFGGACCTGYEAPGAGSCDSEQDLYVSTLRFVVCRQAFCWCVCCFESDAVLCVAVPGRTKFLSVTMMMHAMTFH